MRRAKDSVAAEVKVGLINGLSDNILAPKDQVTRAQAATVYKRILKYLGFIN